MDIYAEDDLITFSQAMSGQKSTLWNDVMKEELDSMAKNQVWDLVELPKGGKAIGYKWVCTRLDIAYVVKMLGKYQSNPSLDHWKTAKKVMRYLQGIKDYKLTYRRSDHLEVVGYSDFDFAACVWVKWENVRRFTNRHLSDPSVGQFSIDGGRWLQPYGFPPVWWFPLMERGSGLAKIATAHFPDYYFLEFRTWQSRWPPQRPLSQPPRAAAGETTTAPSSTNFHGLCYVLKDNIDTDQIIPAEHLTLVPSNPDEYRKLGSFALVGLPSAAYPTPFMDPGEFKTKYPIIIGGANFGCGSSREHAPVALGASGVRAVVAESYARIFFRNSVATGEIYPLESEGRMCDECSTGDVVTVEFEESKLINHTTGKEYKLKPIGDAGPVIEAGGIFAYARKTGMISTHSS
ncbi:uncharacterized protein [Aristolochia californica]|uniref:uncharacterized protein n=1 Tax=Aristolochia californica TaxID=171875 RepID=UPI0035DAB7E6